jgi:hypothetical protein
MTTSKKLRTRHVASDEAHAWARSLPLNNPNAKTVLRALALYVNGEGACFVGIEQLAEDTDLSADTVRRRLVWLEQIGAIVRLPQWLDGNGRRNSDGKGKRTSDEIRMLLQADIDDIERAASGLGYTENGDISSTETTSINPSSQQGLNSAAETVSPAPALGQPSQSCEGLISEPEPEISPQPPSGGTVELEGWKDFEEDWGEPILRQSIAQQIWAALKADEREFARKAARGYVVWLKQQKRPPNRLSAHLFLRERDAWEGFAKLAADLSVANGGRYDAASFEGKAVIALHEAGRKPLGIYAGKVRYLGEITPQILAFADIPARSQWEWIEDREQIGAWNRFFNDHLSGPRGSIFRTRGIGVDQRKGIEVPWPWPPLKNGKTGPPDALASEEELADFK